MVLGTKIYRFFLLLLLISLPLLAQDLIFKDSFEKCDPAKPIFCPNVITLTGAAQKGPFAVDSEIIAYQLSEDGSRSSESSSTVTTSNLGDYETEITWQGLTEVVANGKYFDEVSAAISPVSAQLSVITAIQNNSLVNINLFTHLQSVRFTSLLAGDLGLSTEGVLELAEQELRAEIGLALSTEVATLDLTDGFSESRSDNASLLLFSAAVAQYVSGGGTIDDLVADFADDGEFDGSTGFDFGVIRALATTIGLDSIRPALINLGAVDPPTEEDLAGVIQTVMSGIYDTGSSQTLSFKTADGSPIWLASDESEVEVTTNVSGVNYISRLTTRSSDGLLFETNFDAFNKIVDWHVASTNLSVSGVFDGATPGRTVVHDESENVTYQTSSSSDSGSAGTSSTQITPLVTALPAQSQSTITSVVNIDRCVVKYDSPDLRVSVLVRGASHATVATGKGGLYRAYMTGTGQYEADLQLLDPAPFVGAETARCEDVFTSISNACAAIDEPATDLLDNILSSSCKAATESAKRSGLSDVKADSLGAICERIVGSRVAGISTVVPLCAAANTASILQVCKVLYQPLLAALVNGKFRASASAWYADKPGIRSTDPDGFKEFETLFSAGIGPTFTIDLGSEPRIESFLQDPLNPSVDDTYMATASFNCAETASGDYTVLRYDKDGHLKNDTIDHKSFNPRLPLTIAVASGAVRDEISVAVYDKSGKLTDNLAAPVKNDPPTAMNLSFEAEADTLLNRKLVGTDKNGALVSYRIVGEGPKGILNSMNLPWFSYMPNGVTGTDSFDYVAYTIAGDSDPATVTININIDPFVGSWMVTEVATSSNPMCNETTGPTAVTVSMLDGSYSVSFLGGSLPGTRVGDELQISLSGSFPDDGGTTTQMGMGAFTSHSTFSGSLTWTFVGEKDFTCSGSSEFLGTKDAGTP